MNRPTWRDGREEMIQWLIREKQFTSKAARICVENFIASMEEADIER